MSDLKITDYRDYETFARAWQRDTGTGNETEIRLRWQLLGQLKNDELLIHLPEWLADENTGFIDGATPTEFVGRIDRETEQAILFADSAAAPKLAQLAHRIHSLEDGLENAAGDEARHDWLQDRLEENRQAFEQREDVTGLVEEWLPKSQLTLAVRRIASK